MNNSFRYHKYAFQLILLLFVSVTSKAYAINNLSDTSFYREVRERLQVQQDLEALDQNLAGEAIDLFTGNVTFTSTDISIPGNSKIPVQITRTLNRSKEVFKQFGDWELNLPRIVGKYNQESHMTCQSPVPPAVPAQFGGGSFVWNSYHKGITLYDGSGYSGRLIPISAVTNAPFSLPSGTSFYTKDHWIIKCSGDAYIAYSPSGLKYTFSSLNSVIVESVCQNNDDKCMSTRIVARRVTKIEDRFGNYVNYLYDTNKRLYKISSSDGREVYLNYVRNEKNLNTYRIDSVESNGRLWQYQYREAASTTPLLSSVVRPDGSAWQYRIYNEGCNGPCDSNPVHLPHNYREIKEASNYDSGTGSQSYVFSITHPEGAEVKYEFGDIFLHRFGQNLRRHCSPGSCKEPADRRCSVIQCKGRTVSISLLNKKLYYKNGEFYEWSYNYSDSEKLAPIYNDDGGPISDAAKRQTTTITGPDGITEVIFNRMYDWNEGAELWRVFRDKNGKELSRVVKNWEQGDFYGDILVSETFKSNSSHMNVLKEAYFAKLTLEASKVEGSTYYKKFSNFNTYQAPEKIYEYNDFSSKKKYTKLYYQHDTTNWLLNLPTKTQVSSTDSGYTTVNETSYYSSTGGFKSSPYEEKLYGNWIKRYTTYHSDGNLKKVEYNTKLKRTDGSESSGYRYARFDNYKRGKPQLITYPARYSDNATIFESQVVDTNGWTTSITDLNGNYSSYSYDGLGRVKSIDLPDSWLDIAFDWTTNSEGLKVRNAKRCSLSATGSTCGSTPTYIESTTYDRMLRPILSERADMVSGERRYQNRQFNVENQPTFESYWSDSVTENAGITSVYDGLKRLRARSQSGGGTETTDYLSNNRIQVTNARGYSTTSTYLAYGAPSYEVATKIESPEGVTTSQVVNLYGDVTSITQTGPGKNGQGTVSQTEYRAYNSQHQLCKVVRKDVGQTAYQYSLLGEMQWIAEGVSGGSNSDCASNASSAEKVLVSYDNLGGAWEVDYPDTSPDVKYSRDPQGNLETLAAGDVVKGYSYNSLNLLEGESLSVDDLSLTLDYQYSTQGHLRSLVYPDSLKVDYAPNGFGEPTQAIKGSQPYVNNVRYFANGAIDSFTFGNGLTHKTTLNSRQLPSSIKESSVSKTAMHFAYEYDNQSNITKLTDHQNGGFSLSNLSYDGLDRLIATNGGSGIGSSHIGYDGLGNITGLSNSSTVNSSSLDYHYDLASNRLATVSGGKAYSFQYDSRGNVTHNGSRGFTFNRANQLVDSEGNQYRYDGHNRRVKVQNGKGTSYSFYNSSGKLIYRQSANEAVNYVYLGSRLIAKDGIQAPKSASRQHYKPFGETIESPKDEVGYAGHKFDTDIGLTYMQARYYDPVIGRFYSNDPVGYLGHLESGNPVQGFNRYAYANNNPYKYNDPDGEFAMLIGAAIGAALDAGIQVSNSMKTGSSFGEAVKGIDLGSVAASAALGAVGGGATQLVKGALMGSMKVAGNAVKLTGATERVAAGAVGATEAGMVGAAKAGMSGNGMGEGAAAQVANSATSPVPSGTIISKGADYVQEKLSSEGSNESSAGSTPNCSSGDSKC